MLSDVIVKRLSFGILTFAGIILVAYITLQAFTGAPVITVTNNASSAVSNVVLSGSGYRTVISKIEPGETVTVVVHPRGESDIRIEYLSPAGQRSRDDLGYIEPTGGYCYDFAILSNYEVKTLRSDIGCFSWKRIIP